MLSLLSQSLADGLKRNLVLKKLDLCENRIDLEGAMALAEIFRLNNGSFSIVSRLECTLLMVTTSFVSSLHAGLTHVKLAGNALTDEGVFALKEAATRNTKLTYTFS